MPINCIYFSERGEFSILGITLEGCELSLSGAEEKYNIHISSKGVEQSMSAYPRLINSDASNHKAVLVFDIPLKWKIEKYRPVEIRISTSSGHNFYKKTECGKKLRHRIIDLIKGLELIRYCRKISTLLISHLHEKANPQVFLHCWNPKITKDIIEKISVYSKSLRVVLVKPSNINSKWFDESIAHASSKKFKSLEVLSTPPMGRDIGGFISGLLQVLGKGDTRPFLILHSKNTEFLPQCLSEDWRNSLIDPLVSGTSGIIALLKITFFGSALVCSKKNMRHDSPLSSGWKKLHPPQKESYNMARDLSLSIFQEKYESFTYCAGTMMWVNPNKISDVWTRERLVAFQGLLEPSENLIEPSHAHAFERLFPEALKRHGKKVSAV